MRAREGDFLETVEGLIFDVKGLVHPPERVVAYLRYVPDAEGDRERGGVRYRKVYPLEERTQVLEERWPRYVYFDEVYNRRLQGVPLERIKHVYRPVEGLRELRKRSRLDDVEARAVELLDLLRSATDLPWRCLGVSGSLLTGLHVRGSDIDPVVYGVEASERVWEALRSLLHGPYGIQRYDESDLRRLYEFRSMERGMSFEDFLRHEGRKVLEGRFMGVDYFIRCVKRWDEVGERYGENVYYPVGDTVLRATVEDDGECIFTPCKYLIKDVEVLEGRAELPPSEIVSFRGRFCEQVFEGE
ncbi:MAG: hypothetical protein ACE5GD_02695, partial [Candidatus Geothermarchaeales archaeon]